MRYEIPPRMEADLQAQALPRWPQGIGGGLAAELDGGAAVSVPVPEGVNILTVGVTGTGKTCFFTAPAAALLLSNPQRKAVFFELKATYVNRFFRPGDKLISYRADGLPPRALFRWNMIREIRQSADREAEIRQISEFLFREQLTAAGQNLSWIAAARDTFSGVLRVVVDGTRENTSNRELIGALRQQSVSDLLSYLAAHPQNHGLLKRIYGYDSANAKSYQPTRRSCDVMFFLHSFPVPSAPTVRIPSTIFCAQRGRICFSFTTSPPPRSAVRSWSTFSRSSRMRSCPTAAPSPPRSSWCWTRWTSWPTAEGAPTSASFRPPPLAGRPAFSCFSPRRVWSSSTVWPLSSTNIWPPPDSPASR